ncbi:ABC transporter permease [Jidongwangia harbinensis]|uniref:ABC transporter permease n=1 Tax=Jidongwangia harbinensis TaxID=2878561 RepID=UPI001CD954F3|nr:ABC transporter permease [Jidongwangia harbinensis]MCA2214178.1 ABC transporter permease [Jidongwangia harbinensis]
MIGVLRSEWTKFRSVRSTPLTAALTVVLAGGLGMLISRGLGMAYLDATPAEQALFDPTQSSLSACFALAQLAVGALGVISVSSEYGTGMIRTSLTAVPRRGVVLAAKAGVVGLVALAAGSIAVLAGFLLGQPVLRSTGAPSASIGDPHVLRALAGGALWMAAVGLLGVALGILLRATAGAFAVLVAVTLVIPLLADMLPPWFGKWWPPSAGREIFQTVPNPEDMLPPWAGLGLMYAAVAAVFAVAFVVFRTRDA